MINYYELVKNNPEYFKQFSCKNLLFLNYDCPVKVKKATKWSQYHYIYYVLSGKKTLHTTDGSYYLTKGSIAFVRKGACIIEQFFDEPFCIVVFIIPDEFIVSFMNEYMPAEQPGDTEAGLIIPVYEDVRMTSFYQSILPYFATQENIPESILELKFKELFLNILLNPDNIELKDFLLTVKAQALSPLYEVMEANYPYNLSIEDYAKLTNRSVSSFKRDFQSTFKTTPGRWLMEKKLAHAKRLLMESNSAITNVAFDSGFENTAHFSRLFKQKTGITPMDYRKKKLEREALSI